MNNKVSLRDNEQNQRLSKLEEKIKAMDNRLRDFISNEFIHFRDRVEKRIDWILWVLILGFLTTIAIRLF